MSSTIGADGAAGTGMPGSRPLEEVVAAALGIEPSELRDDTSFRSIPQWDSLGHVELMLALEEHWAVEIGADLVTRLTSVAAIRAFDGRRPVAAPRAGAIDAAVHRGLSGVYFDESEISGIDAERGRLSYRGYSIDDLVAWSTFEETAFLLLSGRLPDQAELHGFAEAIREAERLPAGVADLADTLAASLGPVDALRTGISALAGADGDGASFDQPTMLGAVAIGRVAGLAARLTSGQGRGALVGARDATSFAGRLLAALGTRENNADELRIFDRCLILLAEHGSNASAFAGRVAIGTRADIHAALTAALSVFAGPLHGGAIEGVAGMIEAIGEPSNASRWVAEQRARREPVFGFGHRLYRTEDPRAPHLRAMAEELSRARGDMRGLHVLEAVRREMADRARLGIDVNVDLYAGLVFSLLGIRTELHVPVFAVSRTAGWTAHAIEQRRNNVLIRPLLRYTGAKERRYLPLADRGRVEAVAERVTPAAPAPPGRLHSGFIASVARTPSAPALRTEVRSWSYAELDDVARRWAAAIIAELGRPASRVGVFAVRSEASYAGTLAALLAGGAFVPLSPEMPVARSRRMLAAADVDALIVGGEARQMLANVLPPEPGFPVLDPDGDGTGLPPGVRAIDAAALRSVAPLATLPEVEPDATAYLLFTSGSTGEPKGVPISHANAAHFLEVNLARYGLSPDDRLSQTFQQTFDLSVFDLFMAWGSGACLCVPEPIDLVSPFDYVVRNGITVWFSVPSLATLLLRKGILAPGTMATLRWSLFCGEALPVATADAWHAAAPDSILENLYGPTECTIACTSYRWRPGRTAGEAVNGLVPIGVPWEGVTALVSEVPLGQASQGSIGELAVGGRQTFGGYWRRQDATVRALFERGGETFYRTGDRVTVLPSGDLAFLGRLDHQVKVLGHRVELGEVEAALRAQPGVSEAVALATGLASGSSDGLAAFVLGSGVDPVALAERVRQRLPVYMVPRTIHVMDEFPRNASGKIDRRTLQQIVDG